MNIMNILYWIIFGGIIGFIADLIDKKQNNSLIINIIIGILGAVVGGWISGLFGIEINGGFNILNILFSVIGALIVLAAYRFIARRG
jgi:uncharacterized membrane protein YeaQ/YmgE (transglycosylase-associated protein family)